MILRSSPRVALRVMVFSDIGWSENSGASGLELSSVRMACSEPRSTYRLITFSSCRMFPGQLNWLSFETTERESGATRVENFSV